MPAREASPKLQQDAMASQRFMFVDEESPSQRVIDDEESSESEDYGEEVDDVTIRPTDFDPDTFSMTVVALARDSYFLARRGKGASVVSRYARIVLTVLLGGVTLGTQMFLLLQVEQFVCARAVHDIRLSYDLFEKTIYGEDNCTFTRHGHHRGDLAKFNPSSDVKALRLSTLKDSDQDDICRIPLSQPKFFAVILVIWTLTCVSQLKKAFHMGRGMWTLETIDSMANALEETGDADVSVGAMTLVGLTMPLKLFFIFFSCVRFAVTAYLLWLGCRWLLATSSFADLILNAVALEFILLLKDGFYMALVPYRNKVDLEITKIKPRRDAMSHGCRAFAGSFWLLGAAVAWVVVYMVKLQEVLPGYNWDIRQVCVEYIKKRFEV